MDFKFKSCDIVSTYDNSIISKLIRYISKSTVSHTAIMYDEKFVIESWISGVRIISIEDLKKRCNFYVSRCELTDLQSKIITTYLQNKYKSKYDLLQLLTIALHKIFGIKILNNHQKYICSELVWEAYTQIGMEIAPQVDESDDVTPKDLIESQNLKIVAEYIKC